MSDYVHMTPILNFSSGQRYRQRVSTFTFFTGAIYVSSRELTGRPSQVDREGVFIVDA